MRFIFISGLALVVDQVTKYIIYTGMLPGESIPVFPPVFYITYVLNPGAAFGLLAHRTNLFIIVSLLVVAGVIAGYRYLPRERTLVHNALGLVVGGALGNLIDRIRLGRVVDFLDFRVWPVFNLADTAIVIGALLLVIDVWRADNENKKRMDSGAEE